MAFAASAATINVPAGGDFQQALNSASPGDVITLAAGAVYQGPFVLPPNTGSAYITIRTSAPDSSLPAAGVRITPDYASVLPKLQADWTYHVSVISTAAAGSSHYRFVGVEISPTPGAFQLQLVQLATGSETSLTDLPSDFVFDRCYIHGDPSVGTRRGIAMNAANVTVMNSYLSDFKDVGPDAQALASWNSPGPLVITNNYLEGAGENILIGGQDPTINGLVPTGISIKQNLFSKPMSWYVNDPSYAGTHWTVKSLLEFKNAQQIVVDGNTFENNWADAQSGYAILFTPRNQNNTAPWSIVANAQFTNNIIRHVTSGINILGTDDIYTSQQLHDIVIRNNLFENVTSSLGGTGRLFQILNGALNVTMDHNTGFEDGAILIADEGTSSGLTFTNNLVEHGGYGFFGSGVAEGSATLAAYLPNSILKGNAIIGGPSSLYPAGNYFPTNDSAAGFTNETTGDFSLLATSPLHGAATDGADVGVNAGGLGTIAPAASSVTPAATAAPVTTSSSGSAASAGGGAPVIAAGGIVNAATFGSTFGAGSVVSVFGSNLSSWVDHASSTPLPTTLANTQILANGTPVPLLYASPTQLNFQLPMSASGNVTIQVVTNNEASASTAVNVASDAPGILTLSGGAGAVLNQDGTLNTPSNPAADGSIVQIYAIGLGATNPALAAGEAASSTPPLNSTASPVSVSINGNNSTVSYAGGAPGFAALYQVNATVPNGVAGAVPLQIGINGQLSNIVSLNTER